MTLEKYRLIIDYLRGLIAGTQWEDCVYAVGGCCRDEQMGRDVNDIDLAVNQPNGGILFARWLHGQGLTTGSPVEFVQYGTAMLSLREFPDEEIEIVQTRKGGYTRDGNATDVIQAFGTVEDDAMRRDLTINTLFCNVSTGELLDCTGRALTDIAQKRLATPLPPEQTFEDDPVRIMRCIRMEAQFGWSIDGETLAAIRSKVASLKEIKIERIRGEFEKMLAGPDPVKALKRLRDCGLMRYVAPELERTYGIALDVKGKKTMWSQILAALNYLVQSNVRGDDISVRWAILLHGIGMSRRGTARRTDDEASPDFAIREDYLSIDPVAIERTVHRAEVVLRKMHYHGKFVNPVLFLIRNVGVTTRWDAKCTNMKNRTLTGIKKMCVNEVRFDRLLALIDAINHATPGRPRAMQVKTIRRRIAEMRPPRTRRR